MLTVERHGKAHYLGWFDDIKLAEAARIAAERALFTHSEAA